MNKLERLVRPHILKLNPYSSARDDFEGSAEVFIDANENPVGAIPEGPYNRYPDPHQRALKGELSKIKGVSTDRIFLGNGSDEPIDLLIRAFCEPEKDSVLIMPPTYGMFKVSAEVNHVKTIKASLTKDFQINLKEVRQALTDNTKILFLCSPNNPTGNLLERYKTLELLNDFEGLVVVDEAYIDFSRSESLIAEMEMHPNLVVLQTFSKAWGLAALRLGVAYAHPFVISILNKIKPPYNVDKVTQEAGIKALQNLESKEKFVKELLEEREKLRALLTSMAEVQEVHSSDANFLLVRFNDAQRVNSYLRTQGIIVRDRSKELHCDECLRITVGTSKENDQLIEALSKMS